MTTTSPSPARASPAPARFVEPIETYFSGARLYGDDFDAEAIAAWYADEAEAYAELGAGEKSTYRYGYHAWNRLHGFRHLPAEARFKHVLAFGSAYGDELLPIVDRIDHVTLVDPSDAFDARKIGQVPITRAKPAPSGDLALDSESVDLVTCFGVLHHIPNVSHVIAELARVTACDGRLLIREPIVSMGDWRQQRPGLTVRERGIPAALLRRACRDAGLRIEHEAPCGFALTPRLFGRFVRDVYDNALTTRADAWLSQLFKWNRTYHATTVAGKIRPTCMFLVLRCE